MEKAPKDLSNTIIYDYIGENNPAPTPHSCSHDGRGPQHGLRFSKEDGWKLLIQQQDSFAVGAQSLPARVRLRWPGKSGQNRVLSFECHESPPPAKRRRYNAAFRAEALRLASESRSTQAAARALNIHPKRIYKGQKEALTPVVAAHGAELDPATAAELRQLRAANRWQA